MTDINPDLLVDEAYADGIYGFPSGTMEALGATESSQGSNLGTIGNTFQILPSTAASPGYGLGTLDGNSAVSSGSYLSALQNGPAGGDLSTAFAMYQGGAANPTPYGANTPVSNFLAGLTGGTGSASSTAATSGAAASPDTTAQPSTISQLLNFLADGAPVGTATTPGATAGGGVTKLPTIGVEFFRVIVAVVAVLVLGIGLAALALKSSPQKITIKGLSALKGAVPVE